MSFLNKVWRVGVLGSLAVALVTAACADDQGALFDGGGDVTFGSISGRVTDNTGAAVVGALVGTSPATSTALTDANGNYRIENIPIPATGSASFAVTASKQGLTTGATGTRTVTLTTQAPNATGVDLVLTVETTPPPDTLGNLQVLVTDRNGAPQSAAAVVARRAGAADSLTGTTDANGFVIFNNIRGGAYTVRASKTIAGIPFRASGGVNVVAGETAFLQLTLGRDFGQTVFPNIRGRDLTDAERAALDIDLAPVPGRFDTNPDIDCNIIRTQHMFIAQVRTGTTPVSGVKVAWDLNMAEKGVVTVRCPELSDDPAGCTIPTVPGDTGSIVDTDDPDLDPFRARGSLDPAFEVDSKSAITFTNDQSGAGNTVTFGGQTVTVGEGQTWIIITSPTEGVSDVIVATPDGNIIDPNCGLSDNPATVCDKDFGIKRWVNWDTRVFELIWPDQDPATPEHDPGPTRDPHDVANAVFTSVPAGGTFTNILSRGRGATCPVPSFPGAVCTLTGDDHLFISEVRRLRPDSPFNISRGIMLWDVTDDAPDVDFWGEGPGNDGDGCEEVPVVGVPDQGVCNAENNGPSDDQYWVGSVSPGGSVGTRNSARIEFDANNNVFDGGLITQNPLCTAPCDEDDFIGWGVVEVRLDPTLFFCTDGNGDGDCLDVGVDTFSPAMANLIAGAADQTAAFRVRFLDEFGEICAQFTFQKRFVTSRLQIIKNTVPPNTWTRQLVSGQSVKTHTVLVGETFSYTITAINDGDVRAQHVRITDTLPRFGTQFSVPDVPTNRGGGQSFQYINDRPAFDPQAIVYGVDEDNDEGGDEIDECIVGRQAGNANAAAYVVPEICFRDAALITEAGGIAAARTLAISASTGDGDQVVFIQYYDEEVLARTVVGGGVQSEDSVEITVRALPALYSGVTLPSTTCNIATVTDGPFNRGPSPVIAQSLDADTLCHEVREALLDLRKTTLDAIIAAGDSARFRVELSNAGSAPITNVVIRDTVDASLLPPGRKLISEDIRLNTTNFPGTTATINADSFTFSVSVPSVPPTAGVFREVYVLVIPTNSIAGTFCNRVTARAPRPSGELVETDIACVTLTVAIELDISNEDGFRDAAGVFQSAKEIFRIGDGGLGRENELIYQVIVTNRSAFTATNVVMVDRTAPNSGIIEFRNVITGFPTVGTVSATSNAGFTWTIPSLGPGVSAEIQFRAEAVRSGDDVNRVDLTADQLTGSKRDEEPTTVTP
jgi:uncharacterized repeat protein (TIGR01451 family)